MARTRWMGAWVVLLLAGCGSATVKQGPHAGGHAGGLPSAGGSAGAAGSGMAGTGVAARGGAGMGAAGLGAAGMGVAGTAPLNGVSMSAPTVSVNGNAITLSGLISWSAPITFAYRQIAVRPPAGSAGTPFSTAYAPGAYTAAGTTTLQGTGTCDVPGVWTAFETYALVDNPAQSDWIDGPAASFTIGAPSTGSGGAGGAGGGTVVAAGIKLGFSVNGAADGSLAAWLTHHTMDCAGTWNDNAAETQTAQYSIQPSGDFGAWNRCLDLAVGGIFQSQGESWASAAAGAYDDRWRTAVAAIKSAWGARDPTLLNVRFAHEFNLKDSNWHVTGDDAANFKKAWARFHDIFKSALPSASLVWCPNDGTSSALNLDVRDSYPGNDQVDIIAIDTYNQYPWVDSAAGFTTKINGLGSDGSPLGAESWRKFAAGQGKPFAIGEWASNGDASGGNGGDSPTYIQLFHDWLVANGGTGPGQIKYAVFFNGYTQFEIYPDTIQPNARDKVKQLF
jgi:hypothetical protein